MKWQLVRWLISVVAISKMFNLRSGYYHSGNYQESPFLSMQRYQCSGIHAAVSMRRYPCGGIHASSMQGYQCSGIHAAVSMQRYPCGGIRAAVSMQQYPWGGIHAVVQNFAKSSPHFWLQYLKSKVRWRFCKILWPSQNIWTLYCLTKIFIF